MQTYLKHHVEAGIATVSLNRPEAFNALNSVMLEGLHALLQKWENDPAVTEIIVSGIGPKAFCAGGDIKQVFDAKLKNNAIAEGADYFQKEYSLNYRLAVYKKPTTTKAHGYCLGGGMGLFNYAKNRLVDKTIKLGMPEGMIGFFTDVGASYFLPKLPGELGHFVGLTGYFVDAKDSFYCGFSTNDVSFGEDGYLKTHQTVIDEIFSKPTIEEIIKALDNSSYSQSKMWLDLLMKQSPLSLKVIDRYLRKSKSWSLEECLKQDYHLALNMIQLPDFVEGVRAQVVDKDKKPNWMFKTLQDVPNSLVENLFNPVLDYELQLGSK